MIYRGCYTKSYKKNRVSIFKIVFYAILFLVVVWLWSIGSDCLDYIGGVCVP
jgi:hypothetical protein